MPRRDAVAGVTLGGKTAIVLFAFTLIGFVAETQLTQYVQTSLAFRQPYLIFYIVHSFFVIMFPLHFLILILTGKYSPRAVWNGLIYALRTHISSPGERHPQAPFPTRKLLRLVFLLTCGMTVPGLCWFIAVTWAPLTDVTALWNTNAFFAYIVSVKLFHLNWEPRRLAAVLLATAGAAAVVYGGSTSSPSEDAPATSDQPQHKVSNALIGDLLTLVAAIVYGVYQVLYKIHAALPTDPDTVEAPIEAPYEPLLEDGEPVHVIGPVIEQDMVFPPPFALYPNMLTSAIGFCTLLIFWIPMPIMQVLQIRHIELPGDFRTAFAILGIALSGVVFNAGFMILLGLWGPILTSIGSLLTIVLVFFSDVLFGGAVETITLWSMLGCGAIVFAFGVLAYDMLRSA
ncbi:hypothetical protein BXZ70DRAFT_938346 [Cristinia sonorae]|uniref:EamA domain-containing protein n=1 Tax=Cristinia sonorae TaxID=1940300 RepID=A0A8K0UPI5_9AGAR|nr:hypothetical protein BXZ70DRAFT_938346 [Cristinia sonorae]